MTPFLKLTTLGALGTMAFLSTGFLHAQDRPPGQDRPGPGNFDPEQMRQRMAEQMRAQFDVKDDAEWKLISDLIEKVSDARRALRGGGGFGGGFPGFGGPGGPGGNRPPGGGGTGGPGGNRPPRDGGDGAPAAPAGNRPAADGAPADPNRPAGDAAPGGQDRNRPRGDAAPGGFGGRPGGGPGGFNRAPDPEVEALQKAIEAKADPEEIKAKLANLRSARKEKQAKLEKAQEDLRGVLTARQEAIAVVMGLLQ